MYSEILENFVFLQTESLESLIFQQDGAPPHYAEAVQTVLNSRFPEEWKNGKTEKLPSSSHGEVLI